MLAPSQKTDRYSFEQWSSELTVESNSSSLTPQLDFLYFNPEIATYKLFNTTNLLSKYKLKGMWACRDLFKYTHTLKRKICLPSMWKWRKSDTIILYRTVFVTQESRLRHNSKGLGISLLSVLTLWNCLALKISQLSQEK